MPLGHISGYKVTYKFPKYGLEGTREVKETDILPRLVFKIREGEVIISLKIYIFAYCC